MQKKQYFVRPQAVKTACIVLKMASFDALNLAILNLRNSDIYSHGEATKCAY